MDESVEELYDETEGTGHYRIGLWRDRSGAAGGELERGSLRPETLRLSLLEAKALLQEVQNAAGSAHRKASIRSYSGHFSASCDSIALGSTIVGAAAARRRTAASARSQSY
jgi:hypothetical protein